MQQIIKQAAPSRQLFETLNFAFMKNFDFLVKITIFGPFSFSWVICVTNYKEPKHWKSFMDVPLEKLQG